MPIEFKGGFGEAIARERFLRDAAFLDITETVGRFELKPMTLRHYMELLTTGNQLAYEGMPGLYDLASFLWLLSPEHKAGDAKARSRFYRRCKFLKPPKPPLIKWLAPIVERRKAKHREAVADMLASVLRFVRDALCDCPRNNKPAPQYYSAAAGWVGDIAREYGWRELDILEIPLKRLFQYHREIIRTRDGQPLSNPSDDFKDKWLAEQDAKLKEKAA